MERRCKEARMKEGSEGKDDMVVTEMAVLQKEKQIGEQIETKGGKPTDSVQDLDRI